MHVVTTETTLVDRARYFLNEQHGYDLPYIKAQPKDLPPELPAGEEPPNRRASEYRMRPYYVALRDALAAWQGALPDLATVRAAPQSCANLRFTVLPKTETYVSQIYEFCTHTANSHATPGEAKE